MLKLAGLAWLRAQADALRAALPTGSVWGEAAFTRLNGGLCGGAGASPLKLQPLDFDGAPQGDPLLLHSRAVEGGEFELAVTPDDEASRAADAPREWTRAHLVEWAAPTFRALHDGSSVHGSAVLHATDADSPAGADGTAVQLFVGGDAASVLVMDVAQQAHQQLSAAAASGGALASAVHSPMPGKIVRVLVAAGQAVSAGEPLVVLEAMKMEHTMKAPADVTIGAVHATEGDVVAQRALLLSFEADAAAPAA